MMDPSDIINRFATGKVADYLVSRKIRERQQEAA